MHILVVEDEVRVAGDIVSALIEAGHSPVVIHDRELALEKAAGESFDLIVLGIDLPQVNGFEVLRRLRSRHVTSRVLILTARGEVKDRITGLQLGADDSLAKPFAIEELVARVRALGRRYAEEPALNLRVGDLTLHLPSHEVYRGRRLIELSKRELMLLKVLIREPGRVFTRTELSERVWEAPARTRPQAGGGFHWTAAKKNWCAATDLDCAPRWVHDSRSTINFLFLAGKL
jgi:DNA-binding response OmpR family regulator